MKLCGIEKLSLVDFDGYVSATVFTGGCNFLCGFCHNSALVTGGENLAEIPEEEILSYLKKRQGILEGLCITGGEPTLHKDLPAFCEKVKSLGYKIKLDSNGTNPEMLKTLYTNGLIDYCAMDIKNDKDNYGAIIGIDGFDTKKVEKSVEFLMTSGIDYEFRTTIMQEYHKEDNIKAIASWIAGAKKYFLQKYKDSENCITRGLNPVDTATAQHFVKILEEKIEKVALRGYDV